MEYGIFNILGKDVMNPPTFSTAIKNRYGISYIS